MSTRGAGTGPRRARQASCAALAILAAPLLGACGSSDFANQPRPAPPIEVTAQVGGDHVVVSPDHFGAGLVTFTIANLSESPVRFTLSGPKHAATPPIQPGVPANMKLDLPQGSYQASAGQGAQSVPVKVGPERTSSRNKLQLP
ncbi:MAG: hypothetical protein E6G48_09330 [Actinobacteria bacterium]|nr:MAG: hypothetical protein E6G48_09330 [Actinomycetota bacterium]